MNDVLQQISNIGIIPVIAIEDAEQGGASGPGWWPWVCLPQRLIFPHAAG